MFTTRLICLPEDMEDARRLNRDIERIEREIELRRLALDILEASDRF